MAVSTTSDTQGTHDDTAPAELLAVFVVGDGRQCLRLASHPSHLDTFLSTRDQLLQDVAQDLSPLSSRCLLASVGLSS